MKSTACRLTLFILALLVVLPVRALACACCSEKGDYSIAFRPPSDNEIGMLGDIRFGKDAFLYLTDGGFEVDAQGLPNPSEKYIFSGSLKNKVWRLSFRDQNRLGTLVLPLPIKMISFAADIHDQKESGGGGPLLYKEWR